MVQLLLLMQIAIIDVHLGMKVAKERLGTHFCLYVTSLKNKSFYIYLDIEDYTAHK